MKIKFISAVAISLLLSLNIFAYTQPPNPPDYANCKLVDVPDQGTNFRGDPITTSHKVIEPGCKNNLDQQYQAALRANNMANNLLTSDNGAVAEPALAHHRCAGPRRNRRGTRRRRGAADARARRELFLHVGLPSQDAQRHDGGRLSDDRRDWRAVRGRNPRVFARQPPHAPDPQLARSCDPLRTVGRYKCENYAAWTPRLGKINRILKNKKLRALMRKAAS